ncbi:DNA adenine methylase [Levilactobacillus brevis]|uniref:DNA adenine methylase n=1 Tax=Levilactobacillus brevis TaxID=1580 RepID=UPI000847DF9A|nr:DNA adenine methylase [Levilactobacillus brevis]ODP93006.1 DNA adenine methylase [Levilactobacillus brevis]ODP94801.1 DNA adenine methylase [Levilactobacillus brevis]QCZ50308.1 prophage P2a protein 3 DNA adenine methylase [Levilactobacillus brevis]
MPHTASPFRYPGGKTQLYSFVHHLLEINNSTDIYIEPFAGGAGIPIKLLANDQINYVWINDYDKAIYSVWDNILNKPDELISLIQSVPFDYYSGHEISADFSISFWKRQKQVYLENKNHQHSIELAFSTLFLNRTNTSGIITADPLGGLQQKSQTQIYVRFNKKTLIDKINFIYSVRNRIKLTRLNALDMIPKIRTTVDPQDSFIFFDPPYFAQGKNLYYSSFNESGHANLAKEILALTNYKWITTYDTASQINENYKVAAKRFEYYLNYSANNKRRGKSLEYMFASPITKINSFDKVNLSRLPE